MEVCLLPDKVEQLKKDLKDRTLNIADLLKPTMTSEARTAIFAKYAHPEDAKVINTLFESKLILKNRILGIQNLIEKLGKFGKNSPEAQAERARVVSEYKAAQQKRIFNPLEQQSYLNDLVDKQIKSHVTLEQARVLDKLSNAIKTAQDTTTAKLSGVSDEYLKAHNNFNNYKASLKPLSSASSIGRNLSVIFRNHLLMNPATPIKTTFNQVTNSLMEGVARKFGLGSLRSPIASLAKQANNEAWKTFRETGNNTAAMENINDTHVLGKGENFRVPTGSTKGTGLIEKGIRVYARITNKIAIDWEHNISFTKFYQKTFFDAASTISGNMAKGDKAQATEIFKDAIKIEPQTKEGRMVRTFAQAQAARVTSTNDTWASTLAVAGKNALNKISPGMPLGDLLVPIAKIPANIVANGILNSGVAVPWAVKDIIKGRAKMQSDNLNTKYEGIHQFSNGIIRLMATVGTLAGAAALTSQLKKEDFRSDQYGAHFVKIGDIWINTEYFSILGPAIGGMMEARKEGSLSGYFKGVGQSLLALPVSGVEAITSVIKTGIIKSAGSFVLSRGVPAFVRNISPRPQNLLFGAHGVETTQQVAEDKSASATKASAARAVNSNSRPKKY
jgi:hypothetical protein